MSIHQSSVYVGSIAGGAVAGSLGQFYGWRPGFRLFGAAGIVLGCGLWLLLREPERGQSESISARLEGNRGIFPGLRELARNPAAWLLVVVFMGANFVAMIFTVWMPDFLFRKFHMSLGMSGLNGAAYLQIASVIGVLAGGALADRSVRRQPGDRGARMRVQALGLFLGVPFLFLSGWTSAVGVLLGAMAGFGLFKGVYDSNLWAALYDVTPVEQRGTALGVMNSLGWLGGAAAQLAVGVASARYGMSACLSATALVYLAIATALWIGSGGLTRRGVPGRRLNSLADHA
jgi:sugar phosphate permease